MERTHPELRLEVREQENKGLSLGDSAGMLLLAPMVDADYWSYRVVVDECQAILGFPKFSTVGIGFAVEEDWNTNLPYTCTTEKIFDHIKGNKGNDNIPDSRVREAIAMIQEQAYADRPSKARGKAKL